MPVSSSVFSDYERWLYNQTCSVLYKPTSKWKVISRPSPQLQHICVPVRSVYFIERQSKTSILFLSWVLLFPFLSQAGVNDIDALPI